MIDRGRSGRVLVAAVAVLIVCGAAGTDTAPDPAGRVLTLTVDGPGSVSIAPGGTVCRGRCSERFRRGASVRLVARPRMGTIFVAWGGSCETAGEICELSLERNLTVRALFAGMSSHPFAPTPRPARLSARPPFSDSATPQADLERALRGLRKANVAFNTPATLRRGETTDIQLLLSIREPLERLKRRITEIGEIEGADVRVSDDMEARLTGNGFAINLISAPRQLVVDSETTEWKWEVEATRTGVHRLHLTLTAFILVGDERRARTVETFERTLVIHVTWSQRVSGFVDENWQWLWTAILVPAVAWLLRRRRHV